MNEHGYCPHCNADLDGGSIWQEFFEKFNDEAKADEAAAMYGATRDKGQRGRAIGIYDFVKDRTMVYRCPDCGKEWGRQ